MVTETSNIEEIIQKIPGAKVIYHQIAQTIREMYFSKPRRWRNCRVMFYPEFRNIQDLLDIYYKACYYLLPDYVGHILIPISSKLELDLEKPEYYANIPSLDTNRVQFIRINESFRTVSLASETLAADYIFVWDKSRSEHDRLLLTQIAKLQNVDSHQNQWDGWVWGPFCSNLQPPIELEKEWESAQIRFNDYIDRLPNYSKAYIFGTGPSLEIADQFDFSDGYRIVCNTIVKNNKLLDHIQPHFIVAADAIYHFGNTLHAYQFRQDLERVLTSREIIFLTTDDYYPLLLYYHPEIASRTIPLRNDKEGVYIDLKHYLAYSTVHNILNGLLLPLATSLANEIYLLGFDGRAPGDVQFWQNSDANAYNNLKASITSAHPGFFSAMDYNEYAKLQSDNAEMIMSLGEKQGKHYYCLNKTYIPAFQKRQIKTTFQETT